MDALGWSRLDIILVTGDAYIDSPYIGAALIGKVLMDQGYRVGIIAQPDTGSGADITRLGEPALFWGITGGCVDSMVANYTATKKFRNDDDYTPGGVNDKRPDRAVIVYTNLVRRHFKSTVPIVLGGIEASLRRISHYDFWSGRIRRSILFDAKADYLVYGMGENTVVRLARHLEKGLDPSGIEGLGYISRDPVKSYLELPSFESVKNDHEQFTRAFLLFYENSDPVTAQGLVQKHADRYLVLNRPADPLSTKELDRAYGLFFERDLHPLHKREGEVRALDTIRFSIPTHRGCYGQCRFCSIGVHEGTTVTWRSEGSIVKEAEAITRTPGFKGIIHDLGGPTANMYGYECDKKLWKGICRDRRCLTPRPCKSLKPDHSAQIRLLDRVRRVEGVRKVFVSSGIRYDLILEDNNAGKPYLQKVVGHHTGGQMKVAPEHSVPEILKLMGKPPVDSLLQFKSLFDRTTRESGKKQFLTYYLIAAHPGCRMEDMKQLRHFTGSALKINPRQVQIFTPTPSTVSTLMYCTGLDPFTGKPVFVERNMKNREKQKAQMFKTFQGTGPEKRKHKRRKTNGKKGDEPGKNP